MSEQAPEETPDGGQDEAPAVFVQAGLASAAAQVPDPAVPVPDGED